MKKKVAAILAVLVITAGGVGTVSADPINPIFPTSVKNDDPVAYSDPINPIFPSSADDDEVTALNDPINPIFP